MPRTARTLAALALGLALPLTACGSTQARRVADTLPSTTVSSAITTPTPTPSASAAPTPTPSVTPSATAGSEGNGPTAGGGTDGSTAAPLPGSDSDDNDGAATQAGYCRSYVQEISDHWLVPGTEYRYKSPKGPSFNARLTTSSDKYVTWRSPLLGSRWVRVNFVTDSSTGPTYAPFKFFQVELNESSGFKYVDPDDPNGENDSDTNHADAIKAYHFGLQYVYPNRGAGPC